MKSSPRIYAILAHHDPQSLSGQLFTDITQSLEQAGATVDRLHLYERHHDIPCYFPHKKIAHLPDLPTLQEYPFFEENKERFMAADRLLIVYPIYWYSVPGILKNWIDLITNFAWKLRGGSRAQALHKVKHALIVQSAFQPWWRRRLLQGNVERKQLARTFDFIGIPRYSFYEIDSVYSLTETAIEKHKQAVTKKALTVLL
jgi:NAD(P)H dehydrogenase (quinone)